MTQSRRHSLLESACSTIFGFGIALACQMVVYPLYGLHPSLGQNLGITGIFTAVSIVRGYGFRRLFNRFSSHRRNKIPNLRESEVWSFMFRNAKYDLGISRYENGRVSESFVNNAKGDMEEILGDACIMASMLYQFGVSPAALLKILRGTPDNPASIIGAVVHMTQIAEAAE